MPTIIPFEPGVPSYRMATVIDGTAYLFDVRWNGRDNIDPVTGEPIGAWWFDILAENETPIAIGLKVALGAYIGRYIQHPLFREGVLVAVDTEGTKREATLDDLGTRVQVRRYTIAEIVGGDPGAVVVDDVG